MAAVAAVVAVEEEEEEEVVAAVAAVTAVEEEEEEPALGLETVELVVVAAAVEEEDAVVAVEVWLGASKFSMRRLLTRLLLCMVLVYFRLPGMFQLEKNFVKRNHTYGDLTSTMQATKMQRARSFLYTFPENRFETGFDGYNV